MRTTLAWTVALLAATGCQLADENAAWDPAQDYPSWAYDAPFYYRPSEDLAVAETIGDGIPVYFSRHRLVYIKHPTGYQVTTVPRMAVWYSLDQGQNWRRAGFYGAEQTHFGFLAEADGTHWVRFIGAGQPGVKTNPGKPDRVYVVDTVPPYVQLTLDPPTVETDEEGNVTGPHLYAVGDQVTVTWRVSDRTLDTKSLEMATTFGQYPESTVWQPFPLKLKTDGQMTVPVPPEASKPGGGVMRFRIEARDRAGNISYTFSDVMQVEGAGEPAPRPRPKPPTALIAQEQGRLGPRPGWPERGVLVRGGTDRILNWMPTIDAKYDGLLLQFSANNGRSWRTVAENLQAAKPTAWAVPEVNSKICKLRIVGLLAGNRKVLLAESAPFTVHTAPPKIILGPKDVLPEPE